LMGAYFLSRDCSGPCALAHIGFSRDSWAHLLDHWFSARPCVASMSLFLSC